MKEIFEGTLLKEVSPHIYQGKKHLIPKELQFISVPQRLQEQASARRENSGSDKEVGKDMEFL